MLGKLLPKEEEGIGVVQLVGIVLRRPPVVLRRCRASMAREEEGELLHGFARERVFGESGRERERVEGCWGGGELGLTSGPEGGTWRPDSARMTRIRDALADRPRVRSGPSEDG